MQWQHFIVPTRSITLRVPARNLNELQQFEQDAPENCRNKVLLLEAKVADAQEGIHIDIAIKEFEQSIESAGAE